MWRRSSRCGADHVTEQCVEVNVVDPWGDGVRAFKLRSSRNPDVIVDLTPDEWTAFVLGVKEGCFDDLT